MQAALYGQSAFTANADHKEKYLKTYHLFEPVNSLGLNINMDLIIAKHNQVHINIHGCPWNMKSMSIIFYDWSVKRKHQSDFFA